jgi:hypothetical protein
MVLLGIALLLSIACVVALGGRLLALTEVRFRAPWLVAAALGVQILIVSFIPHASELIVEPLHLFSYVLMGTWVWLNRTIPGLLVIGAGGLLNVIAITANGGVMPADPDALAFAGRELTTGEFANSAAVEGARLQILGDIFATPASWPVSNVFSIGDVVIAAGAFLSLHRISGAWPGRPAPLSPQDAGTLHGRA